MRGRADLLDNPLRAHGIARALENDMNILKRVVESEGQEEETYWIYLKPGFQNGHGEHAIAADTKREARSWLSNVESCDCDACLSMRASGVRDDR